MEITDIQINLSICVPTYLSICKYISMERVFPKSQRTESFKVCLFAFPIFLPLSVVIHKLPQIRTQHQVSKYGWKPVLSVLHQVYLINVHNPFPPRVSELNGLCRADIRVRMSQATEQAAKLIFFNHFYHLKFTLPKTICLFIFLILPKGTMFPRK